jgi:hypothetical protein
VLWAVKRVAVRQYKDLVKGNVYTFRSFGRKGYRDRKGKLIAVHTRWKDKKDEEGKVVGKELVADTVLFEPLDDFYDWYGEKLKIYYTTIGCGLFQIFNHGCDGN